MHEDILLLSSSWFVESLDPCSPVGCDWAFAGAIVVQNDHKVTAHRLNYGKESWARLKDKYKGPARLSNIHTLITIIIIRLIEYKKQRVWF